MPSPLPLQLKIGKLSLNFTNSAKAFYRAFLERIEGKVDDTKVLTGWTSSTTPTGDAGPWFRPAAGFVGPNPPISWYVWDNEQNDYVPSETLFISADGKHTLRLQAPDLTIASQGDGSLGPSGVFSFQGTKGGTVALLLDLIVPRETIAIKSTHETSPGVYNLPTTTLTNYTTTSNDFIHRLTKNSTINIDIMENGTSFTYLSQNIGTAFDVTFNGIIEWPGGGAHPTTAHATAGTSAQTWWVIRKMANRYLGQKVGSPIANPTATFEPGGPDSVPHDYGGGGPGIPTKNIL